MGVTVPKEQAEYLGSLALGEAGGVEGGGYLAEFHGSALVGLEEAGVVAAIAVTGDLQLEATVGGVQGTGVVAVAGASVFVEEGLAVEVQEVLDKLLGHFSNCIFEQDL